ncbi:DUF2283 domain-containing protein [Streptomyces sp. NPDC088354]|uniref:DUF2283 domain-containing protein n=1 Tax=Streptomyces sp. NPDC088354 TaxID=3365856 RepID=UPI0037F21148
MTDLRVTYDRQANAAYVYFSDPAVKVARCYPCDPVAVDGMINLDFDDQGCLVGIEVLDASSKLPGHLLSAAERIDHEAT